MFTQISNYKTFSTPRSHSSIVAREYDIHAVLAAGRWYSRETLDEMLLLEK